MTFLPVLFGLDGALLGSGSATAGSFIPQSLGSSAPYTLSYNNVLIPSALALAKRAYCSSYQESNAYLFAVGGT